MQSRGFSVCIIRFSKDELAWFLDIRCSIIEEQRIRWQSEMVYRFSWTFGSRFWSDVIYPEEATGNGGDIDDAWDGETRNENMATVIISTIEDKYEDVCLSVNTCWRDGRGSARLDWLIKQSHGSSVPSPRENADFRGFLCARLAFSSVVMSFPKLLVV